MTRSRPLTWIFDQVNLWIRFKNSSYNHTHKKKNKLSVVSHARINGMFEIVVAMIIQSAFCLEMHQNKVFLFFKNYFWY